MMRSLPTGVHALFKLTSGLAIAANVAGTLIVLALVLIVNYDVVARGLFNSPFRGAVEVVQFSMVLIVFLQLPDVVRVNKLTRSDGFLTLLGASRPAFTSFLRRLINLCSAIFMFLVALAIWPEFVEMYETNDFFGVPGIFTAPWWPVKLTIFLSAALCLLLFLIKVLTSDKSVEPLRPSEHPEGES